MLAQELSRNSTLDSVQPFGFLAITSSANPPHNPALGDGHAPRIVTPPPSPRLGSPISLHSPPRLVVSPLRLSSPAKGPEIVPTPPSSPVQLGIVHRVGLTVASSPVAATEVIPTPPPSPTLPASPRASPASLLSPPPPSLAPPKKRKRGMDDPQRAPYVCFCFMHTGV
jgi:hypothetical protein